MKMSVKLGTLTQTSTALILTESQFPITLSHVSKHACNCDPSADAIEWKNYKTKVQEGLQDETDLTKNDMLTRII